jgi:hypothetical protein
LKLAHLEGSTTGKNAPGDARELIGERDRQHVAMKLLPGRTDVARVKPDHVLQRWQ